MTEDNSFLGVGWAFPPYFSPLNGDTGMVKDETDIYQSLFVLLSTHPGERIMDAEFGCNLRQFVFEEISQTLFTRIKKTVKDAIRNYEPRIDVNDIDLEYDYDDNILRITIDYTIRQINSRQNMVYPFYFLEGTNIPNK